MDIIVRLLSWGQIGRNRFVLLLGVDFGKEDHPPGTVIKHPREER
jgi:hypothetical protein